MFPLPIALTTALSLVALPAAACTVATYQDHQRAVAAANQYDFSVQFGLMRPTPTQRQARIQLGQFIDQTRACAQQIANAEAQRRQDAILQLFRDGLRQAPAAPSGAQSCTTRCVAGGCVNTCGGVSLN